MDLAPINRSPIRITRENPKDSWIENSPASVTWNPEDLGNQTDRISIQIARFKNDHGLIKFHSFEPVIDDQENNGRSTIALSGGEEIMLGDENTVSKPKKYVYDGLIQIYLLNSFK